MKHKKAVVAIAKDESPYLVEWIAHYFELGFDGIYLYLNNITDHSGLILDHVAKKYPNVRILHSDRFFCTEKLSLDELISDNFLKHNPMQARAYAEGYKLAEKEGFDYVAFLDLDEYLTPRRNDFDLDSLIDSYNKPEFIRFKWFNVNGSDTDFESCVQSEFSGKIENIGKYILKTGLSVTLDNTHLAITKDISKRYLSGVGRIHQFSSQQISESVDENFVLLHHLYRSENEYLARLLRGDFIFSTSLGLKLNRPGWKRSGQDTISIEDTVVRRFNSATQRLVEECEVAPLIEVARHLLYLKSDKIQSVKDNLLKDYKDVRKVLTGTKYEW